jgi:hypothetical protein
MFTHPALLREMTLLADFLRRNGEAEWSRRVVLAADGVRKAGWTKDGLGRVQSLFAGDRNLHSVTFGFEHHRWVGGETGVHRANDRLEQLRRKVRDLSAHPVQDAPAQGPRKRSPDLG